MRRTSFLLPLFALALTLGLGCSGKEPAKPAPAARGKSASTPEEAIALLLQASKANNRDDYYAQLAEVYSKRRDADKRRTEARKQFDATLVKHFGPDAVPAKPVGYEPPPDWDPNVLSMETAEVIAKEPQNDGTMLLRVKIGTKLGLVGATIGAQTQTATQEIQESEERFTAVKEGGAWKLAPWTKVFGAIGGSIGSGTPVKPVKPPETTYQAADLKIVGDEARIADRLTAAINQLAKDVESRKYSSAKEAQEALDKKLQEIAPAWGKQTFGEVGQSIGAVPAKPPDTSGKMP